MQNLIVVRIDAWDGHWHKLWISLEAHVDSDVAANVARCVGASSVAGCCGRVATSIDPCVLRDCCVVTAGGEDEDRDETRCRVPAHQQHRSAAAGTEEVSLFVDPRGAPHPCSTMTVRPPSVVAVKPRDRETIVPRAPRSLVRALPASRPSSCPSAGAATAHAFLSALATVLRETPSTRAASLWLPSTCATVARM